MQESHRPILCLYDSFSAHLLFRVVAAGGHIGDKLACLEDGARPQGIKISGSDALVI